MNGREVFFVREIEAAKITDTVKRLCIQANVILPEDVKNCIIKRKSEENWAPAREILDRIEENFELAAAENVPICQDTGVACVFLEIGQEVHIAGGDITQAVNEGVRQGYAEGYLRKSVVRDPLDRVNTEDNTPAVIHTRIVPGDKIHILAAPKGFGSENMSQMKMFTPSAKAADLEEFVVQVARDAGGNPCPPMVLGVGFGGDFEFCAYLAKKALCRPVSVRNENPFYAEMEVRLLERINALGIGPQGFGGKTTALAVNIEVAPTHIAGLPAAVNIGCHVTRHAEMTL